MSNIRIRIAGVEKMLKDADESWILQQINRRQHDGQVVCVQVTIYTPSLNMILSTPTCAAIGGSRVPNPREQEIFNLWAKHHLDQKNFNGEDVVSFLNQLASSTHS